jgi:signal transduction histidine kinase
MYIERLLQAMLALYQLLRQPLPLDDLLQHVLDTALTCIPGAQRGSLMVCEGDYLYYRVCRGYDLSQLRKVRFLLKDIHDSFLSGGDVGQVDNYVSWDAEYLDPEANTILREYGLIEQIRRSLITPVYVGGQFYGTLALDNMHSHAPFPPEAVTLAAVFAEQIGTLIEQALLLDELRQTRTVLVEAEKMASLGRFVASIAHEINNPLTSVIGYADLLLEEGEDVKNKEMLDGLLKGAERVRDVVQGLQIFARQQRSGKVECDIHVLIEQTLTLKKAELLFAEITVVRQFAPDLPTLWLDPGQLSQVLLNLLTNAQHALRERAEHRQIVITTGATEYSGTGQDFLHVMVADNGPGISKEIIDRIFEPFFTTRAVGEGTGLGLSICYGIMTALGGHISVVSEPGQGATFLLELPLTQNPARSLPSEQPALKLAAPAGLRILVIDDDREVTGFILRLLATQNTVLVAERGDEGLEMLSQEQFDRVLCDLKMPGMTGIELFERLRSLSPESIERVIFMSGDTHNQATRDFVLHSGRPLLRKPFTIEEIFRVLA